MFQLVDSISFSFDFFIDFVSIIFGDFGPMSLLMVISHL